MAGKGKYGEQNGKDSARKSGAVGAAYNAEFRGFINLNLSPAQKGEFTAWIETADLSHLMAVHTLDGVVLSIKVDAKSGGFLASATQRRENSPNAGLAVTARASEPVLALQRLMFMLELLPADGWEKMQPMADPDRW